jgi:hypothetical protein
MINPNDLICFLTYRQIRAAWVPEGKTCVFLDHMSNKLAMIVFFLTNVILLVILLIGLLCLLNGGNVFGLWSVLWKQVGRVLAVVLANLYPDLFLRSLGCILPICYYGRRATSSGKLG